MCTHKTKQNTVHVSYYTHILAVNWVSIRKRGMSYVVSFLKKENNNETEQGRSLNLPHAENVSWISLSSVHQFQEEKERSRKIGVGKWRVLLKIRLRFTCLRCWYRKVSCDVFTVSIPNHTRNLQRVQIVIAFYWYLCSCVYMHLQTLHHFISCLYYLLRYKDTIKRL